jgi:ABC-type transporter Mla MlaB component
MESVNLTCHTDRTELTFQGVFDVGGARGAYETLNEALTRALPVELNTGQLERVDAAALQLLVAFRQAARERGLSFQWRELSPMLRSSAELLGLKDVLEFPA